MTREVNICRRTATTSHIDTINRSFAHLYGINNGIIDIEVAAGTKEEQFYRSSVAYG